MHDHRTAAHGPALPAGARVGHYEIVALIGAGGMGQVYRAHDTMLRREVALKLLPPHAASDPHRRARFEREAHAVAALTHPNIVTIHSVEEADGFRFLTMEFVQGDPLSVMIPRGGFALEKLLDIAIPLADAVGAAHARGITHRDLKPANVMVTTERQVKVLDFGLAKWLDHGAVAGGNVTTESGVTSGEGHVIGTIGYMSPEQAEGKAADARSDVFSLGVMLYEMATGERPFKGDSPISTLSSILRDTPSSVTELNPRMPKELGRVIRRALAKDPDRRQQTGKDLRNELDDIRQELQSGELSVTDLPRGTRVIPQRRWLAGAFGITAVAMIAVALAWPAITSSTSKLAGSATEGSAVNVSVSSLTTEDGQEFFPSLSPDGKWLVYSRANPVLNRNMVVLRAVGGQSVINLTADSSGENNGQPSFSPDGEHIAFRSSRDGGGIFVMRRTGESVRKLTSEGHNPSWSPDGTSLVYSTQFVGLAPESRALDGSLWTVSIQTGERRQLTTGFDAVQPAWSPNGHRIAYWGLHAGNPQRDIWTIPAGGGTPVPVTSDPPLDWSPRWSPDGRYLYFSSNRSGRLNLWRIAIDERTGNTTGQPVAIPIPRENVGQLSFAADGALVAATAFTAERNLEALTFDMRRERVGGRRRLTHLSGGVANLPSVSPDGQSIVFGRVADSGQEHLWVIARDGGGLRRLTHEKGRDRGPVWSGDGKRVMFYSDRGGAFNVWTIAADGGSLTQVTDDATPGYVLEPLWSPDGTKVIAHRPFTLDPIMFDPRGPIADRKIEALPTYPDGFNSQSWSPDGTRIAGNTYRGSGMLIYTVASKTYEKITTNGTVPYWLPDGRRLLYLVDGGLSVIDTVTKRSVRIYSPPQGEFLGAPIISPKGDEIYALFTKPQADIILAKLTQ